MNSFSLQSRPQPGRPGRRKQAFTLVELMTTMAVFSMAVIGFISLQMFGLRHDQLVESKLGASDQSRKLLERMGWEIRSARMWEVGNVAGNNFVEVPNGQPQRGTGIRIYPGITTNSYIQYYFNTNARTLLRLRSGVTGTTTVAQDLTNTMAFQAEDHRGTVQTAGGGVWRNCIRVTLEFAQYQYPLTQVGPGHLYDYYKLEYKVSPHCPKLFE